MKMKPFTASFPVPSVLNKDECYPFDVECLKSSTWEDDPDTLFIIGYVDSGDISNGRLLTSSPAKDVFYTLIEESAKYYKRVTRKTAKVPNMAVINFNYHRNKHLKGIQKEVSIAASARRCRKLIAKLKPKRIVCFGKEACGAVLEDVSQGIHFGIPKTLTIKGHSSLFVGVPSYHNTIMRLDDDASEDDYDEAITYANMIGYISRCMATMYSGKMLFTSEVVPAYRQLTTVEEVDEYITSLEESDTPFAVDCETNQLTSYGLVLSMIQFATDSKEAVIIVIEHHDSPFSKEEQKLVLRRLRKLFLRQSMRNYIVGQNLSYDMRAMRQRLRIPVIHWLLWDIMAGEHALDENLRDLDTRLPGERTSKSYALHKICLRYGISWYMSAEFSKSQRHLIHEIDLTDEVLKYAAMDVQAPMALHDLQHFVASTIPHEGETYVDTFHNYVLYVLGNCTTHTMSTMEHRGIQLSRNMFKELMGPNSELKAKIKEIEDEFYGLESVTEANRRLLKDAGAPQAGLFGDLEDQVFNIRKQAHIQILFVDTLGIEDYEERKNGDAKVGKSFQAKHSTEFKEVELYGEWAKHKAILSTYIVGWDKQMMKNADCAKDYRIRPQYSYLLVTGRSNSFSPNLQNVVEHHKSAIFVKRTMKAPIGYLKMDADYSSHEVRCIDLDMYVDTETGRIQLKQLLDMENPPKAKSFCHDTQQVEYQPIGYRSKHTTDEDMYEFTYEGGSVKLTGNHPVWSVTRNAYIRVDQIQEGEEVIVDS